MPIVCPVCGFEQANECEDVIFPEECSECGAIFAPSATRRFWLFISRPFRAQKPTPVKSQVKLEDLKQGLTVILVFIGILLYIGHSPSKPTNHKEEHFNAWDGSHRGLTALIQKSMNDPKSYEHEKTVYWDKGNHLVVETIFRGKNAFGGVIKNRALAKVDLQGNVIEILYQGP